MTADSASHPLVSVIALCYNHARFAVQCLESIRAQTYRNTEVIIMDDASTDSSAHVIREWVSSRAFPCTFIAHTKNVGVCRTLNEALSRATGKYVSMIATDDVWEPDKLERQVPLMEGAPDDVGVLYSDAWRMSEEGARIPGMFIEFHRRFATMPVGNIFPILVEGNFIPAMTTLIRRSCYATVGPYDERLAYEDWDMWLRLARRYKFVFSPFVSATYRLVSNSLVQTHKDPTNPAPIVSNYLITLKHLEDVASDHPRYRIAANRLAESAEGLCRLNHPDRFSALRVVLMHAHILRKASRLRIYLLRACMHLRLPFGAFHRLDEWMTTLRLRLFPED